MNVIGLLHAVLARAIGRNVRHRTGAIKRDQGDDVLETVGPHVEQRAPHAGAFQLEHADRFRARQQVVGFLVVERDGGGIDVDAAPGHQRDIDIDPTAIPLDDKKTYDLLTRAEAVGVFQLESAGMRRALLDMRPDRFEDIIALVALYRPGPMANIPTYCARKHGMEQPDYIHPKLESVLKETFGVIVYQEQVMQAAQILAGFTLGQADLLRRAMGKKIRKEMQAQRNNFVEGAIKNNIERYQADSIFDLLERFAEYGFNKSHAAAYALVAYQTAYMKANFPVEFLAASMTLDMGNTDKLAEFRAEAERLGAEFGELVGIAHVERHR